MYTISGCGYLKYKNSEYYIGPGQAVVIYCGEYQLYRTASKTPWEFNWIHFSGMCAQEYYGILYNDGFNVINVDEKSNIKKYMDSIIFHTGDSSLLEDVRMAENMTYIMSGLVRDKFNRLNYKKFSQHKQEIDRIIELIKANYNKKIGSPDFEREAHISRFYLIRIFKSFTGMSPYEYLINYRISMSKELLNDEMMSITQISQRVGFDDVNNFIRSFKKIVGVTPAIYRRFWIK
jgi:AraC-like DNA-binding protein